MPRTEVKSLLRPEQVRRFPNGRIETVSHHETTIGRILAEPGWRWSRDVRPIAQTQSCQIHHLGVVLKGRLRIETDAGEVCELEVDDVYDIPPGHDAAVVGDETFEAIEFASAQIFAVPSYGDRFLAIFDGPARAVRCAQAIGSSVANLGIAVRAGIHTGEVELVGTDVRGVAVHEAARVAGAATAGEVLVSATTKLLLAGSGLSFESAGIHQLKGLGEACELFRLASPD